MQQDAHEFLNYLLNTIADLLQGLYEFNYIMLIQSIVGGGVKISPRDILCNY